MGRPERKAESTARCIQAGACLAEGTIVCPIAAMVLLHVLARFAGGIVVMHLGLLRPGLYFHRMPWAYNHMLDPIHSRLTAYSMRLTHANLSWVRPLTDRFNAELLNPLSFLLLEAKHNFYSLAGKMITLVIGHNPEGCGLYFGK